MLLVPWLSMVQNVATPEFLPAEIGLSLYPVSSFNPRTSDPHWIRSTRPCSPRGASASHRLDTKPVNYCDITLLWLCADTNMFILYIITKSTVSELARLRKVAVRHVWLETETWPTMNIVNSQWILLEGSVNMYYYTTEYEYYCHIGRWPGKYIVQEHNYVREVNERSKAAARMTYELVCVWGGAILQFGRRGTFLLQVFKAVLLMLKPSKL